MQVDRPKSHAHLVIFAALALLVYLSPDVALAYVGPGAGLTAIGALLAVVVGVVAALFGFIWYPVKRLLRRKRHAGEVTEQTKE